jgi:hypothetical protein
VIKDKGGNDYREGVTERRRTQKELEVAAKRKQPSIDAMYKQLRQKLLQQGLPAQYLNLYSPPEPGGVEWVDDNEWQRLEDEVTNRRKSKIRRRKRSTFTPTEAQSAVVNEVVQRRQLRPRKPRKPTEFKLRWAEGGQFAISSFNTK